MSLAVVKVCMEGPGKSILNFSYACYPLSSESGLDESSGLAIWNEKGLRFSWDWYRDIHSMGSDQWASTAFLSRTETNLNKCRLGFL